MSVIEVDMCSVRRVVEACLVQQRMYASEAECVARRLVHSMHCVGTADITERLRRLLEWIAVGAVDPRANVLVQHESRQLVVLDAGHGAAAIAGERAVRMILDRLPYAELVTAIVTRCRPLESAASYVVQLAHQGVLAQCRVARAGGDVVSAGDTTAWGLPHIDGAWLVHTGEIGPPLDWALTHVLAGHGWRFRAQDRVTGGYFLQIVNRSRQLPDGELREAYAALCDFTDQHGIAPQGTVVPQLRGSEHLRFVPEELAALHALCEHLDVPCEIPRP